MQQEEYSMVPKVWMPYRRDRSSRGEDTLIVQLCVLLARLIRYVRYLFG